MSPHHRDAALLSAVGTGLEELAITLETRAGYRTGHSSPIMGAKFERYADRIRQVFNDMEADRLHLELCAKLADEREEDLAALVSVVTPIRVGAY